MARLVTLLATDPAPGPYFAVFLVGFLVAGFGHLVRSRLLIALGLVVIAVTTGLFIGATDPQLGG